MLIIVALCSLCHFSLASSKTLSLILIFSGLTMMNLDVAYSSHTDVFVIVVFFWDSESVNLSFNSFGIFFFLPYFHKYFLIGNFLDPLILEFHLHAYQTFWHILTGPLGSVYSFLFFHDTILQIG